MTLIEMLRANGSWEADAAVTAIRVRDMRIAKLEAALQEFATCACISNCDEKNGRVCELWACRKALDAE